MSKVLDQNFFNRDTKVVAQDLLGKFLVRRINGKEVAVMITETEAYDGFQDKASHAFKGETERTKVMFGNPGNFYVYLCYGMYYMLNIVTRENGYPAAVLIRGATIDDIYLNGPGKLTRFLNIEKSFNNKKSSLESDLWVEDRGFKFEEIKNTARIGIDYAGSFWSRRKLRFVGAMFRKSY